MIVGNLEVMIGSLVVEDFGLLASRKCLDGEATFTESLRPKFHPEPRSQKQKRTVLCQHMQMQSSKCVT